MNKCHKEAADRRLAKHIGYQNSRIPWAGRLFCIISTYSISYSKASDSKAKYCNEINHTHGHHPPFLASKSICLLYRIHNAEGITLPSDEG